MDDELPDGRGIGSASPSTRRRTIRATVGGIVGFLGLLRLGEAGLARVASGARCKRHCLDRCAERCADNANPLRCYRRCEDDCDRRCG